MAKTKLKDVAELAGVSIATASYVLNDRWKAQGIRPETAERVSELAAQHGFVPNRTATFLKKGRYHLIALVSPHCADFYADLLQGIEEEGEKYDYQILFCSTFNRVDREEAYLKSLIARCVDGVIILPVDSSADHLAYLEKNHVPTVFFRRRANAEAKAKFLTFDDFEGGRLAAQHLLNQGCRRIAYFKSEICGQFDYLQVISEARGKGCARALEEAGSVHGADGTLSLSETRSDFDEPLLGLVREQGIDGIVGFSDRLCIPIMRALRRNGLRVPQDVRVVGFDNSEMGALAEPALSSIGFPKVELGSQMVQAVLRMLDSGDQETDEILLRPELVARESSG